MYILLSPTKTMNLAKSDSKNIHYSTPFFKKESNYLVQILKKIKMDELKIQMKLSEKLMIETFNDIKKWGEESNQKQPAVLAYQGTAFKNLNPLNWSLETNKFAQKYLLIISGLYGILKPFDLIEKYRLEIGLKFNYIVFFQI